MPSSCQILYQDDHLLVLNKPAGIPVHAGPGGGETVEDWFPQLQFDAKILPMLAHRLDRDTSGCLILGRTKAAIRTLGRLFEQKRIRKSYWAVVQGTPEPAQGRIDAPLAKQSQSTHRWHMKVSAEGQPSLTDYRVLGRHDGQSWLELKPLTGRTHQLRVHCAHKGWPIVGDRFYGADPETTQPLMLHAATIAIPFVQGEPVIHVTAPPPPHMLETLLACGYKA